MTAHVLEKALDGERITEADAVALLRSRDLVSVGRAANELRRRKTDPGRITFIIDRNLNYTNICVTDCDFCAFYRRPGDRKEGYLARLRRAPQAVLRVSLADKVHNARAVARDLRTEGPAAWERFKARRPEDQIWYYRGVLEAIDGRFEGPLADELRRVVDEMEGLSRAHAAGRLDDAG